MTEEIDFHPYKLWNKMTDKILILVECNKKLNKLQFKEIKWNHN